MRRGERGEEPAGGGMEMGMEMKKQWSRRGEISAGDAGGDWRCRLGGWGRPGY